MLAHVPVVVTFSLELNAAVGVVYTLLIDAGGTLEWLVPCVHSLVSVKHVFSLEDFWALVTSEDSFLNEMSPLVRAKIGVIFEDTFA